MKAIVNKKQRRNIPLWSKTNWSLLKEQTAAFSESFVNTHKNRTVQENYAVLKGQLKNSMASVPSKLSSTRSNLPWLTAATKRLCRKKRRAFNKARSGSEKHRVRFKELQNKARNALRKDHWDYVNGM